VNGLGSVQIKKPSPSGLANFEPVEIVQDIIYSLTYDGTYFQLVRPFVNEDVFNVKHIIEPQDYIVVPQYYQYWVYGDLEIFGQLVNYGHVIIANGALINSGGTFSNFGQLALVNLTTGSTTSYNDSLTIEFDYQNTIIGPSVSASIKQNSLTSSYLDTGSTGGPTAGYFLSVNNDGTFKWVDLNSSQSTPVYQQHTPLQTSGNDQPTGAVLSSTPSNSSRIQVFVNGQLQRLGDGLTTEDCYFFDGVSVSNFSNLSIGDELYWNGTISGFDLDSGDSLQIIYES
jgi:hypothetical protein